MTKQMQAQTVFEPIEAYRVFEILQLWEVLGNSWSFSMELNSEIFSKKKVKTDMDDVSVDELRAMAECDFLEREKRGDNDFWRTDYRPTNRGKRWIRDQRIHLEEYAELKEGTVYIIPQRDSQITEKGIKMSSVFRDDSTQVLFKSAAGSRVSTNESGIVYTYIDDQWEFRARFAGPGYLSAREVDLEDVDIPDEDDAERIGYEAHLADIELQREAIAQRTVFMKPGASPDKKGIKRSAK